MRGRRHRRGTLVVGLAIATACTSTLESAAVEQEVREYLTERGITPSGVSCPPGLEKARDSHVVCEARLAKQQVPIVVTVTDDEGKLSLKPRYAALVVKRLIPEIKKELGAQGYPVRSIDCEGKLWVASADAEHRCRFVTEDGRRFGWKAVFKGDGSAKHRATIVPAKTGGGGPS